MTPVDQPRPRPRPKMRSAGAKPALPPRPKAKEARRPALARLAAVSTLAGLAAGGLLWMALRPTVAARTGPIPGVAAPVVPLEKGSGWYMDRKSRGEIPRVAHLLYVPGVEPGHEEVRTGLVRVNLRTLVTAPEKTAAGKPSPAAEEAAARAPSAGVGAQPPPMDDKGRVIRARAVP